MGQRGSEWVENTFSFFSLYLFLYPNFILSFPIFLSLLFLFLSFLLFLLSVSICQVPPLITISFPFSILLFDSFESFFLFILLTCLLILQSSFSLLLSPTKLDKKLKVHSFVVVVVGFGSFALKPFCFIFYFKKQKVNHTFKGNK